jgi:hypothetical protein
VRVPLSENKDTARRMLNKILGDAELAGLGLDNPFEAEVVLRASRPLYRGDGKYLVQGRGSGGRCVQVVVGDLHFVF